MQGLCPRSLLVGFVQSAGFPSSVDCTLPRLCMELLVASCHQFHRIQKLSVKRSEGCHLNLANCPPSLRRVADHARYYSGYGIIFFREMIAPPEDFHWISAQLFPRACYLLKLAPTCFNLAHTTMMCQCKL